ncbi:lipoyl(octanoyl) transferase LipB [Acetobacter orleanensis]|uniref:Octanoyltransferase n=1 Tax=Acetobacter orleanensis TaxID=104099 RepID=A0A4Y3TIA5_9PROT|nr:lipoyl(octanoyl) transferase LipB [Acetobacter orleanensis]KXV62021.1 octanoyltransferase [Acetobacter orleanensis]PCD80355.1 lipoate-protein ligase B [Acetobacter orleanensis]GAN68890.1 lipoate-protein ligase B [Acetobacter orleanensis JCM 7639]GBR30830.1 lipoate-protein ligase B [Acetobacter orleanensis NRIC 0473]GEB81702.1 octanoyltransferase [Acetobacter orleanensis]
MTNGCFLWEISKKPVPYPAALTRMQTLARDIRADEAKERVWLLEHPPLFTAGTSAKEEDLFNPHNYPTFEAGRGGQWTYHGPGQRIAYVMMDLHNPHGEVRARDVRSYVHGLEEWVIRTLATFGLKGECRDGRVGVWVIDPATGLEEKIAAIGVRVSRWVSWHGVSINLNPRMSDFDGIVPCGIREFGVTSFEKLGLNVTMPQLDAALAENWRTVFGSTPSALMPLQDE